MPSGTSDAMLTAPVFSQRTSPDRTPNTLSSLLSRLKAEGRQILDLTPSNPTHCGIPYPENPLAALANERGLRYHPSALGDTAARTAIAEVWREQGVILEPQQILLTSSTSEAYSFLFKLLANPGEEVLIPEPSYPLFEHLARLDAVVLKPYRLAYDGAWHIDLNSVCQAVTERTRALLVVHPNNPTGNYLKLEEFKVLTALGLPIISDEVFSTYPLMVDPTRVSSALTTDETVIFGLGGLSKLAGLPQLKAGWIGVQGPPRLVEEAIDRLELIADTYLSVSTPVQLALPELLARRHVTETGIRERTRMNLERLQKACADTAATVLRAEGGWYAVVRLPLLDDYDWAVRLLDQESVLVQPGWFYDFQEEGYVIVSLLTPPEVLSEGIQRILGAIERS